MKLFEIFHSLLQLNINNIFSTTTFTSQKFIKYIKHLKPLQQPPSLQEQSVAAAPCNQATKPGMQTRVVHVTASQQTNLLCYGCRSFMQIGQKCHSYFMISERELFSLSVKYCGGGQLIWGESHKQNNLSD